MFQVWVFPAWILIPRWKVLTAHLSLLLLGKIIPESKGYILPFSLSWLQLG